MLPVRMPDEDIPEGYTRKVWAAHQPQYEPLPSLSGPDGAVLARWHLTLNERQAILDGADIELTIWTHGKPLQPHRIDVQAMPEQEPRPREDVIEESRGDVGT